MKSLNGLQWRMLLLTMFCYLFFYTGRHNFGWAAKQLAVTLNVSYEKIGWISFAMLIGYAVGQLVHGNMADRYSPRHLITMGGLLSAVANVLISFSASFTVILVLWTLNGYFQSMAWAAGSKIISNWWRNRNKGIAFGMYTMAAGTSSIITYLLSILLMHEGWRNIFRIPVLFMSVACVIFFVFVCNRPEDMDYTTQAGETGEQPDWKKRYKTVFTNKRFLVVCLSIGFQSMARYGLLFWIPLYFQSHAQQSAPSQLWISLLLPIGMAVGALSFGFISDKLFRSNRIQSIFLGMAACALTSILLFLLPAHQAWAVGILIFFAGFFSYGPQANFWPLSPEILGHEYMGTGVGVMNMCAYAFAALGEPLMGRLIDVTGNKGIIFLIAGLIALLSAISILGTLLFQHRRPQQQLNTLVTL